VVETIEAALSGADAYYWLVQGYGDPERLAHPFFTAIDIAMTGALVPSPSKDTSVIGFGY